MSEKKEKIFYYQKKKKPYLRLDEDSLPIIRHNLFSEVCFRVEKLGSGQMKMEDGELVRFDDLRVFLKEEKLEDPGMKCSCIWAWADGERVIEKEDPDCPFSSHRKGTISLCQTQ